MRVSGLVAVFFAWVGLSCAVTSASADEAFVAVHEEASDQGGAAILKFFAPLEIRVWKGKSAVTKDWPASFHRGGDDMCGGTLVSDRVLLTARHCLKVTQTIRVARGDAVVKATCTLAPDDGSLDEALCLLTEAVGGAPFERVNLDARLLRANEAITFVGAGCTNEDLTGADGVFRVGETRIEDPPQPGESHLFASGGSAICRGDSGGGAFLVTSRGRILVGANSTATVKVGGKLLQGRSRFAVTSSQNARAFIQEWARDNTVAICGVTPNAKNCRPPL